MNVVLQCYRTGVHARDWLFTWACRRSLRRLGKRSLLELPIRIWGESEIEIGDEVFVGTQSWLHVITRPKGHSGAAISIGNGTSISGFCTISAAERIVIERNVLIARYVYIADHSHAHGVSDLPVKDQGITDVAAVRICEGAWLGQGVVICPGVTIGRNAVIGANAVVRSDVPDYCVAAGVPARVIRRTDERPLQSATAMTATAS
jgi:lipopolysaccharide O-acetyltransferase